MRDGRARAVEVADCLTTHEVGHTSLSVLPPRSRSCPSSGWFPAVVGASDVGDAVRVAVEVVGRTVDCHRDVVVASSGGLVVDEITAGHVDGHDDVVGGIGEVDVGLDEVVGILEEGVENLDGVTGVHDGVVDGLDDEIQLEDHPCVGEFELQLGVVNAGAEVGVVTRG